MSPTGHYRHFGDVVATSVIAQTSEVEAISNIGAPCQKQKVRSSVLEQISRYNELLNFAGSVENSKCPGVPKEALYRRAPNNAKAAKNLHCLINDVEGGFGRIKFRNCRFAGNAPLGDIMLPSRAIHQKCR
jgi:hypothetical protein